MLGGYRSILLAAGLGLVAVASLGWVAESRCNRQQQTYQAEARKGPSRGEQSQFVFQRGWLPCLVEEGIANPQAPQTNEHEQRDLVAQEAAALWGFWIAAIALLQLIATVIGLVFIKRTLDATWKAVEEAGEGTKAATIAAQASAEALYGVERPVIVVSMPHDQQRFFPERATFGVDLRNIGQQVGMVFGLSGRFVVSADAREIPELDSFGGPKEEHCVALMVGEVAAEPDGVPYGFEIQRSALTEAEITGLADRSLVGFLVVGALYSDLLQKMRKMTVLFLYEPPTPGMPHGRFIQLTHGETRAPETDQSIRMNAHRKELQDTLPILWGAMKDAAKDDFKEAPKKPRWYERLWKRHERA